MKKTIIDETWKISPSFSDITVYEGIRLIVLVGKKKFAQNAQTFCFFFGLEKPDTEMEKARARPSILLNTLQL